MKRKIVTQASFVLSGIQDLENIIDHLKHYYCGLYFDIDGKQNTILQFNNKLKDKISSVFKEERDNLEKELEDL